MMRVRQSRHKEAVEDWKEGEPVKVWFDMDDNLCIEYESGEVTRSGSL